MIRLDDLYLEQKKPYLLKNADEIFLTEIVKNVLNGKIFEIDVLYFLIDNNIIDSPQVL